jgi:hypothetical protein
MNPKMHVLASATTQGVALILPLSESLRGPGAEARGGRAEEPAALQTPHLLYFFVDSKP